MTSSSGFRLPWLLTLIVLPLLAALIGLGVWQVQRLAWKEGLIRSAEAAQGAGVVPLDVALDLEDPEFRQVLITCPGLERAPFVELQSMEAKQVGVRLVSLCRPSDRDEAILIDRGFIPEGQSERPLVEAGNTMPSVVHGVLRTVPAPSRLTPPPTEGGRFYGRDMDAMARKLGWEGKLLPYQVYALNQTAPSSVNLSPSAPPVAFSNNHLGYALTWFGLALALIGFYLAVIIRRLNHKDTRP